MSPRAEPTRPQAAARPTFAHDSVVRGHFAVAILFAFQAVLIAVAIAFFVVVVVAADIALWLIRNG
jgi:hypothetical protein